MRHRGAGIGVEAVVHTASVALFIAMALWVAGCGQAPSPEPSREPAHAGGTGAGEAGVSDAPSPSGGDGGAPGTGDDPGGGPQSLLWQEVAGSEGRAFILGPTGVQGFALPSAAADAGLVAVHVVQPGDDALWHEFWVIDSSARTAERLGRLRDPSPGDRPAEWTDTVTVCRLQWHRRDDGRQTLLVFIHGRIPEGLPESGRFGAQLLALHHPAGEWEALGFVESPALSGHAYSSTFTVDGLLQVLTAGDEGAVYRFAPDRPEAVRLYGPVDSHFHLPLHLGSRGRVLAWSPGPGAVRLAEPASGATVTLDPGMWEYFTLVSVHPDDGHVLVGVSLPEYVGDGPEGPVASGFGELRLLAPDGSVQARWQAPAVGLAAPGPAWSPQGTLAFVVGRLDEPDVPEGWAPVRPERVVVWDPLADPEGGAAATFDLDPAAMGNYAQVQWLDRHTLRVDGESTGDMSTGVRPVYRIDMRSGSIQEAPAADASDARDLPEPLASLPAAARPPGGDGSYFRLWGAWSELGLAVVEEDVTPAQAGDPAADAVPYRRLWFVWDDPAR